uniref:Uncharacterized protein n=1 Tax=Anguilla anguilla TaxID=7936 RepID=A0A0E9X6R4_ANGAN
MLNVLRMLRNNSNPLLKRGGGFLHPIVLEHSIAPRFSCAPLEALRAVVYRAALRQCYLVLDSTCSGRKKLQTLLSSRNVSFTRESLAFPQRCWPSYWHTAAVGFGTVDQTGRQLLVISIDCSSYEKPYFHMY